MKKLYGSLALLLAACVWGFGFVAQSVGLDSIGPYTLQSARSFVAAAVLYVLVLVMDGIRRKKGTYRPQTKEETRFMWRGGIVCGVVLTVAACLQQIGLLYTTAGKAGFLTSMYMLVVPVLGLMLGRKPARKIWFCIAMGVVGMYFMSIQAGTGLVLAHGDGYEALCAVAFAFHIMVIDHYAPHMDGVKLSCIQFFVSGVVSLVPTLLLEHPTVPALMAAGGAILYAGAISGGCGYTLQIIGQQYAEPVTATLLMSLESVFSMIGGALLLSQIPTLREFGGAMLILAAVILVQLPERTENEDANREETAENGG